MDKYDKDIDQAIRLANSHKKNYGYQQILANNVSSYGAKKIESKREKKNINKKKFSKNAVRTLLYSLIIVIAINFGLTIENIRFDNAVDYISSNLVVENVMDIHGKDLKEKIKSFIIEMESKGLSEITIMTYMQELYGNEIFDLAAQSLGFKDGGEYMISKGYEYKVVSSSGENVYANYPKEIKYKIESKHDLVDEVNEIKENRKGR